VFSIFYTNFGVALIDDHCKLSVQITQSDFSATMEINSPLVQEHSPEEQSTTIDPPSTLFVSKEAEYPLALEVGENSDLASNYDLCMVFEVEKGTTQLPQHGLNFCRKMIDNGLDIYLFYGIQKLHIFVLIRANFDVSCLLNALSLIFVLRLY
jgi:hypothetical protein